MTDPALKLNLTEDIIRQQILDLTPERFRALAFHIDFRIEEAETESGVFDQVRPKESLYLGQGRHKAQHFARMRLATASLEQKRALDQLQEINEKWDELEHDSPIWWQQDELAGDFVPKDRKKPEPKNQRCCNNPEICGDGQCENCGEQHPEKSKVVQRDGTLGMHNFFPDSPLEPRKFKKKKKKKHKKFKR